MVRSSGFRGCWVAELVKAPHCSARLSLGLNPDRSGAERGIGALSLLEWAPVRAAWESSSDATLRRFRCALKGSSRRTARVSEGNQACPGSPETAGWCARGTRLQL